MGRLAVQALEGARKVITNTNVPFLATNWYVATFQGKLFAHLTCPPKRWISGKSSNRFPLTAPSKKVRTFSTNDAKRVLHCDLPEVSNIHITYLFKNRFKHDKVGFSGFYT